MGIRSGITDQILLIEKRLDYFTIFVTISGCLMDLIDEESLKSAWRTGGWRDLLVNKQGLYANQFPRIYLEYHLERVSDGK